MKPNKAEDGYRAARDARSAEKYAEAQEKAFDDGLRADERYVRAMFTEAARAAGVLFKYGDLDSTRVFQSGAPTYFTLVLTLWYETNASDVDEVAQKLLPVVEAYDRAVVYVVAKSRGASLGQVGRVLYSNESALLERRAHPGYAGGAPAETVPDARVPPGYP